MGKRTSDMTIRELTAAIGKNPQDIGLWLMRALKHEQAGDFVAAVADNTKVIELNRHGRGYLRSHHFSDRARLYAATGKLDDAIADYTEAIKADEKSAPRLLGERAAVLVRLGRCAEAADDYVEAIRIAERHPYGSCSHGINDQRTKLSWLRSTCPDDAVRDGAQALELLRLACQGMDSFPWDLQACLAAAYAETGDFANAVEHQAQALEQASHRMRGSEDEFFARALALYKEGKPLRDTDHRGYMTGLYTEALPLPRRASTASEPGPLSRILPFFSDRCGVLAEVVCVAVIGAATLALLLQFGIARFGPHSAPEPPAPVAPQMTPIPDQGPLPRIPPPGNPPPSAH